MKTMDLLLKFLLISKLQNILKPENIFKNWKYPFSACRIPAATTWGWIGPLVSRSSWDRLPSGPGLAHLERGEIPRSSQAEWSSLIGRDLSRYCALIGPLCRYASSRMPQNHSSRHQKPSTRGISLCFVFVADVAYKRFFLCLKTTLRSWRNRQ